MDRAAPTEGLNDQPDEPLHRDLTRDPAETGGGAVEDDAEYERAVEEDTVAPPAQEQDPGADELAPDFREPDQTL